jgi:hypothetical protein
MTVKSPLAAFGAALLLGFVSLTGCAGKEEEVKPTASTPAEPGKTSSEMPPEAKARMEQAQKAMQERAGNQGQAYKTNPATR